MCSSPYSPRARARTLSTDSSACFSSSRTSSRKSFPSAVSITPRGLRRTRSTPISSSKSRTCRLNAGCATWSRAAALVKFNTSPTTRKYRRCRSSIAELHYADKAWQREENGIGRIPGRGVNKREIVDDRCVGAEAGADVATARPPTSSRYLRRRPHDVRSEEVGDRQTQRYESLAGDGVGPCARQKLRLRDRRRRVGGLRGGAPPPRRHRRHRAPPRGGRTRRRRRQSLEPAAVGGEPRLALRLGLPLRAEPARRSPRHPLVARKGARRIGPHQRHGLGPRPPGRLRGLGGGR